MNAVKVLHVSADPKRPIKTLENVPATLQGLRPLIGGGWLEGVSSGGGGWHGYCDEEGKLKRLPVNDRASSLAHRLGWDPGRNDVLCGDVIFLGDGPDGTEADVPTLVLDQAANL